MALAAAVIPAAAGGFAGGRQAVFQVQAQEVHLLFQRGHLSESDQAEQAENEAEDGESIHA